MAGRPPKLSETDRTQAMQTLPGWEYYAEEKAIRKTFKFSDFSEAWGFMTRVALLAEKIDHHPEWFNVYNRVEVKLTTHDGDGVTMLDIQMATAMESFS